MAPPGIGSDPAGPRTRASNNRLLVASGLSFGRHLKVYRAPNAEPLLNSRL